MLVSLNEIAPLLGENYGESRVDYTAAVLGFILKLPPDWRLSLDGQYGRCPLALCKKTSSGSTDGSKLPRRTPAISSRGGKRGHALTLESAALNDATLLP